MLNTGKLNKRITFQRIVQQSDFLGDHPVAEDIKTVWACVKPLRGTEYYEAQKLRPERTYKVTCRFFRYMDGETSKELEPDMRIKYRDKILNIEYVVNIDEEDREYEIQAAEVIRKGVSNGTQ